MKKAHLSEDGEALPEIPLAGILSPRGGSQPNCPSETARTPKWFAVRTVPRHEKSVASHLNLRGVEHYLPIYHSLRKWRNGLNVTLDLPLFPGYLFVRIHTAERVRVLQVPGILAIVSGTGGEMAPLPQEEIEALRTGLPLRQAEPHPLLTVGQRARIRTGALAGLEGVVLRKKNSLRVVLTVDLIMQSVAVEVDREELDSPDLAGLGSRPN